MAQYFGRHRARRGRPLCQECRRALVPNRRSARVRKIVLERASAAHATAVWTSGKVPSASGSVTSASVADPSTFDTPPVASARTVLYEEARSVRSAAAVASATVLFVSCSRTIRRRGTPTCSSLGASFAAGQGQPGRVPADADPRAERHPDGERDRPW